MSRAAPASLAIAALVVVLAVAACADPGEDPTAVPTELTVFAAASLAGALDDAAAAYEAADDATTVVVSADSSAALATQIEQGAPADVFLSADTIQPQRLVDAGLADGEPVAFAANELAIVVPALDPPVVTDPLDLARPGVRVVAAGERVPITAYATRLIDNLAAASGDPAAFVAAYAANVVSREDDVKAVVAKIELGEGDAGIVYATDARAASDRIVTVAIPADANVRATYAGVVVRTSEHRAAARAFLDWLSGSGGQAVLSSFGFVASGS